MIELHRKSTRKSAPPVRLTVEEQDIPKSARKPKKKTASKAKQGDESSEEVPEIITAVSKQTEKRASKSDRGKVSAAGIFKPVDFGEDDSSIDEWNAELVMPYMLDIDFEMPLTVSFPEVYDASSRRRKRRVWGDDELEKPILRPQGNDVNNSKYASDFNLTFNPPNLHEIVADATNMIRQVPNQNQEYAFAMKLFANTAWGLHENLRKMNELKCMWIK